MLALICYVCPAVLGVWCFEALTGRELKKKQWLYRMALNLVAVNGGCFLVKRYILDTAGEYMWSLQYGMNPSTALNYLILAAVMTVILAVVQVFWTRNVKITVEDNPNG